MMCSPTACLRRDQSRVCPLSFFLALVHWGGVGYVLHEVPEVKVGWNVEQLGSWAICNTLQVTAIVSSDVYLRLVNGTFVLYCHQLVFTVSQSLIFIAFKNKNLPLIKLVSGANKGSTYISAFFLPFWNFEWLFSASYLKMMFACWIDCNILHIFMSVI